MSDAQVPLSPPAARNFSDFCDAERERLQNEDAPFDQALFDEAVQLVLRKLSADGEGVR